MKTRTLRHCCVKNCPNQPAKGRKTCGQHGKRRAARTVKLTAIKLDRVLPMWHDFNADAPVSPVAIEPTPAEREYLAGVVVRDNNTICGLPTTRAGFQTFLADWLARPGRSLADIELLAPPTLPGRDISIAICDTAARMVQYDLLAVRA